MLVCGIQQKGLQRGCSQGPSAKLAQTCFGSHPQVGHIRILGFVSLAVCAGVHPGRGAVQELRQHRVARRLPQRGHLQGAPGRAGQPLGSVLPNNMILARVACMVICITLMTCLWPGRSWRLRSVLPERQVQGGQFEEPELPASADSVRSTVSNGYSRWPGRMPREMAHKSLC